MADREEIEDVIEVDKTMLRYYEKQMKKGKATRIAKQVLISKTIFVSLSLVLLISRYRRYHYLAYNGSGGLQAI